MSTLTIMGHSVFLSMLLLASFARPGARSRSGMRSLSFRPASPDPDFTENVDPEHLPHSHKLAGVPLRILLSDHSGPGAALRDTLLTRPTSNDS